MELPKKRPMAELIKRSYSEDEISSIYELGRFCLENGELRKAETIFSGLTEVAPDFAPAWLGAAYVNVHAKDWDAAIAASRQALRVDPKCAEALLFLAACLLSANDFNAAGTFLGEFGDLVAAGTVDNPAALRFYKAQLARYQNRSTAN
jgi:tetratricopeptide (TPR) repeat protein